MFGNRVLSYATTVVIVAAIGLSGCATRGGPGGGVATTDRDGLVSECSGVVVVGALVGGLLDNDKARGAAVGAGIAALACIAWNYDSRQTKTAEQTQGEYRTTHRGSLPSKSEVMRYETRFDPNNVVQPGNSITLASNIEVVQGTSDISKPLIEEEMIIVRPDGKEMKTRKKANEGLGAGGYQTSFGVKMPTGVPQGEYPVRTALYLNGEKVSGRNMTMRVADGGALVALLEIR